VHVFLSSLASDIIIINIIIGDIVIIGIIISSRHRLYWYNGAFSIILVSLASVATVVLSIH